MSENNIFEQASRAKLRFVTGVGSVSVEDLWDLPLTSKTGKANLDDIAKGLYKVLKNSDDEVSFVSRPAVSSTSALDQLRFDIVKHVISVRLAENEAASKSRANAEKRQQILSVLAERENDALKNASVEDLNKMLGELSA